MLDLAAMAPQSATPGRTIRPATPADLPDIARLASEGIHPEMVEEVWALATKTDVPFLVTEVDGVVASTMCILTGDITVADTTMPFVQPEFVTTDVAHRRQGMVADMMRVMHESAASAGVPLCIVSGIEYFYRQFGYSYAVVAPRRHVLVETGPTDLDRWICRPATLDDVPELDALQASVQRHVEVSIASTHERWNWLLALDHYQVVVAEKDGRLEAVGRVYADEDGIDLTETAARSVPAADALLAYVRAQHPGRLVTVLDRPGGGAPFLDYRNEMQLERGSFYLRATTPRLLIDALVPVFNERLRRSSHANLNGTVTLMLYITAFRMTIADGQIVVVDEFRPDGGGPRPSESAFPPELLVDAAFGDLGAVGLEERHPDVQLGDQRPVMRTLFPSVTADFLLY